MTSAVVAPASPSRLLLVDSDPAHARQLERVLRAASLNVDVVADASAIATDARWELVVVNYQSLSAAGQSKVVTRFPRDQALSLFVCGGKTARAELTALITEHGLTNVLAENEAESEQLLVTVQKLLRRDIFGLDKYFPWGAEHTSLELASSTELRSTLAVVEAFAARLKISGRLQELLVTVAEELVTNALYDAPTGPDKAPLHAHLGREVPVTLPDPARVGVELRTDGRRIGIAVKDPFGSLTPEHVVRYLSKCFRAGADQVDDKAGGAGLGLYYVFEALSHLVINVRRGTATEVIGLIDVRGSYKEFVLRGKSFNVFVEACDAANAASERK